MGQDRAVLSQPVGEQLLPGRGNVVGVLHRSLRRHLGPGPRPVVDDRVHVGAGRLRDHRAGLDDQDPGLRYLVADQAGVGAARRPAPDDDHVHLARRMLARRMLARRMLACRIAHPGRR